MIIVLNVTRSSRSQSLIMVFRRLQLFSAAIHSFGHGMNDAQKTMGIIAIVLFSSGYLGTTFHIPLWIVFMCNLVIALGTWRADGAL